MKQNKTYQAKIKKIAIAAALEAGKLLRRRLTKIESLSFKGRVDLVTDVDLKSEKLLVRTIEKNFSDHNILAEEGSNKNMGSDYTWIIDPLDGTTNFVHGFPFFCVSIGVEYQDQMLFGVVYDPSADEMFHAFKGQGAYLNRKKISPSKTRKLEHSMLATGFPYNLLTAKDDNLAHFKNFLVKSQAIRRAGSAALDISYVACGRFDGYWEHNLNPWDTAAAFLIAEEAGACVTTYHNRRYTPYCKEVLATNKIIHSQMVKILSNK